MKNIRQVLLFISYAGFIGVAISNGALNVAWLHIQNEFELPLSAIGILLTFPAIMQLLVSFYSGRLIRALGVGRFLLIGCLLEFIGMIGFVITPSWTFLVISAMIMALGAAALINGFNIFVASNYASSRMNWLHASFGLGATMGPILITLVVLDLELSWRVGYGVMACLLLLMNILVLLTIKHWHLPTLQPTQKSKAIPTNNIFRSPIVWLIIAVMFLSSGIETTTGQLSNSLFVNGRGFDPRTVATWISLYWLSFTAGRFITGMVIDRVNHNLFLRVSLALTIVGASLIWLNPGIIWNFIGLAIMGFAMAPVAPTIMGDTPQRVGVDRAPNIIGYQNTGSGFGIAFFPSMAGIFAELIDLEIIGLFLVMITIMLFIVHELLNYQENRESRYDPIESGND